MTQCQNCNTTTSYAFVGFAQCTPIASCTVRDYYIVNGPCKANNKYDQSALIKDFIPGYIKACNPAMNGSVLPPTVQLDIPCGCPNGLILVDNECVPCEPGSASETGQCLPCQAGYFAPNMIQITDWYPPTPRCRIIIHFHGCLKTGLRCRQSSRRTALATATPTAGSLAARPSTRATIF